MLDARGADRRRRVGTEIARLAPEVVQIGRVQLRHVTGDQHERPSALGDVVEPRPGREPGPGGLFQRGALLVVQPGVGVTASARLDRVDDRRPLVLQHPEGVHAHRETIRDRLRRAHDVGHEPVPHAGRHLRTRDRLVGAPAPAVEIAVGAMGAVDLGRHDPGELRGLGVDPVAPDRRVGLAAGRPLSCPRVVPAAHVRLHRVAATRQGERDVARRGLLAGQQLMGRLEEASLVLLFRREAERELGVGAGEPAVDIEMARLEGRGTAVLRRDAAGEHRGVCRLIAPLPDIRVRLIEPRVFGIRGHEQGATFGVIDLRVTPLAMLNSPRRAGAGLSATGPACSACRPGRPRRSLACR